MFLEIVFCFFVLCVCVCVCVWWGKLRIHLVCFRLTRKILVYILD